jgi:hypothetical protein
VVQGRRRQRIALFQPVRVLHAVNVFRMFFANFAQLAKLEAYKREHGDCTSATCRRGGPRTSSSVCGLAGSEILREGCRRFG